MPGASGAFASIGYGIIAAFLVPRFAALGFAGQNFALTAFGIAFMITRFLGSGYADRCGGRWVLLSAFLIESMGLAGLYFHQLEWLAFASTALTGAGLSLLIPSVTSLVTEAADPRERTAAVGAVTSAWDLGVCRRRTAGRAGCRRLGCRAVRTRRDRGADRDRAPGDQSQTLARAPIYLPLAPTSGVHAAVF